MSIVGKGYACTIGRFQPFHEGHKAVIDHLLDVHGKVLVLVRHCEVDEQNPIDPEKVAAIIRHVYRAKGSNVAVQIIPDICGVYYGRAVGYDVKELETKDMPDISGTAIRDAMPDEFWDFINKC